MIESVVAGASEIAGSEIAKSTTDVASKMDFSKPLDFSSDNQAGFGTQLDFSENKEVSSQLSEKSDTIDTSKALDYSEKPAYDPDKRVDVAKAGENADRIKCRNEDLAGKNHPETEVPFKEKTVTDENGNEVTGVFPEFDSTYDAQLPKNLEQASDKEQFKECNKQLKEAVENDPELAKQFDEEQLEQIENGDTPDGYTWHHNEEHGKMQLVDSETHAKTGHTGGKVIWGGGSENR